MKSFLLMCILLVSVSFSNEYSLISGKSETNLSKTQIKAIFLKKLSFIHDTKVIPINLGSRDPLRVKFEKEILNMSFTRLKSYWTKQHYLGKRPPISMKSQESIKAFVKKVDGAIGYIDSSNLDDSVKEIYRWRD